MYTCVECVPLLTGIGQLYTLVFVNSNALLCFCIYSNQIIRNDENLKNKMTVHNERRKLMRGSSVSGGTLKLSSCMCS